MENSECKKIQANLPVVAGECKSYKATTGNLFTVVTLSPVKRAAFCQALNAYSEGDEQAIENYSPIAGLGELGNSRKVASMPASIKVVEWMKNVPIMLAYDDNICFLECYPACTDYENSSSDSELTDFTDDILEFQARKITRFVREMYMAEPEPIAAFLASREKMSYSQESYGDYEILSVFHGISSQP